ncbi:hypothetical protein SADUNF_Sadunf10G0043500 [Salix dunnii]|uniref:Uncharacterized protein n=1 Tax=Salix dunnii TaxID=1413687 RepID=A0A835MRA6_9ROSI|nr:hypothetical protein SADUNF_Sadunf10G0043500 [Salix dunnii]
MCNCFGRCSTMFQGHDVLSVNAGWPTCLTVSTVAVENGSSLVLTKVINFVVAISLPQELMLQSTQLQVVKKVNKMLELKISQHVDDAVTGILTPQRVCYCPGVNELAENRTGTAARGRVVLYLFLAGRDLKSNPREAEVKGKRWRYWRVFARGNPIWQSIEAMELVDICACLIHHFCRRPVETISLPESLPPTSQHLLVFYVYIYAILRRVPSSVIDA